MARWLPHPGDVGFGWGRREDEDEDADAEEDLAGRAIVTPRRARMPNWRFSFMVLCLLGER